MSKRAERLRHLVELHRRVTAQIAQLEDEIRADQEAMLRARRAAASADMKLRRSRIAMCGTDSGYYRHIRTLKQPACDACKLAHRAYEAERSLRKKVSNA